MLFRSREATRTVQALAPYLEKGMPVIGLEPSCLYTFKDEVVSLMEGQTINLLSDRAKLIEEFLIDEGATALAQLQFAPAPGQSVWVHGHCHQKAFHSMGAVNQLLEQLPGLSTQSIPSSCCGMAGAFGYQRENHQASVAMAELSLLPTLRQTHVDDWVVADGFSCRHQIRDLSNKHPRHAIRLLADALE